MKLLFRLGNKLIPSVFLLGLVLASNGFNDLTDSMNPDISSIQGNCLSGQNGTIYA